MEGSGKRIKTANGAEMTFGQLLRLPPDVRALVLIQVASVKDLFAFGQMNPGMKAFMRDRRVFPEWFKRTCGFPQNTDDDVVDQHVNYFLSRFNGDDIEIYWEQGPYMRYRRRYLSVDIPDDELRRRFVSMFVEEEDMWEFDGSEISTKVHGDHPFFFFLVFKMFREINDFYGISPVPFKAPLAVFSCRRPFDVLCVSRVLSLSEEIRVWLMYVEEEFAEKRRWSKIIKDLADEVPRDERSWDAFVWTTFLYATTMLREGKIKVMDFFYYSFFGALTSGSWSGLLWTM